MLKVLFFLLLLPITLQANFTVLADDWLTQVLVNDRDESSKFDPDLGYKDQWALIDIFPGDYLRVTVKSLYGGLYLWLNLAYDKYTLAMTQSHNLWIWDRTDYILSTKVLGPKNLIGADKVSVFAEFKTIVPFPGSCKNISKFVPLNKSFTMTIEELYNPLITFPDWYQRLPFIFTNIKALGKFTDDAGTVINAYKSTVSKTFNYFIEEGEVKSSFTYYVNDYTDSKLECLIELFFCYKTCDSCSMEGNELVHNCQTCPPGFELDVSNCIPMSCSNKWYQKDEKTIECVDICHDTHPFLSLGNECVNVCPEDIKLSTPLKDCVGVCPDTFPFLTPLNECVTECTKDYPFILPLKQCGNTCPEALPYTNPLKECISVCSDIFPMLTPSKECVISCPSSFPLHTSLNNCVNVCPGDYPLLTILNECVKTCPIDYPLLNPLNECLDNCSTDYPFLTPLKKCLDICPDDYPMLLLSSKQCILSCRSMDLYEYDNLCYTKNELKEILKIKENETNATIELNQTIKDILKKVDDMAEFLGSFNGTFKGEDFFLTMGTNDNRINGISSTSNVSLNDCENKLRIAYNLSANDPLIIMIIEEIQENSLISKVHYYVYNSKYQRMELTACQDSDITIGSYIPSNSTFDLDKFKQFEVKGINICDPKDEFFNSICFPYANDEGLDVIIKDRRQDIYQNVSLCQPNCKFIEINYQTNQSICNCTVTQNITINEEIKNTFINSIPSTNLLITKCYFRLFNLSALILNLGFWIMTVFVLIFIIAFIHFLSCGIAHIRPALNKYPDTARRSSIRTSTAHRLSIVSMNPTIPDKEEAQSPIPQRADTKKVSSKFKPGDSSPTKMVNRTNWRRFSVTTTASNLTPVKSEDNDVDYNLPFSLAIREDKRNLCQIYWHTIRYNYLFFQPFLLGSSFDLVSIKLGVLIFKISTEITINALFFSDNIISQKYVTKSRWIMISSLLKSVYSFVLNAIFVEMLIPLTEYQSLLDMISKEYQIQTIYLNLVSRALGIIKKKTTIFFSIGFVIMLFCWYYCSMFCAVYYGSQIPLIVDEAISLVISTLISFVGGFFIAIMRHHGLQKQKRNMYYTAIYLNKYI